VLEDPSWRCVVPAGSGTWLASSSTAELVTCPAVPERREPRPNARSKSRSRSRGPAACRPTAPRCSAIGTRKSRRRPRPTATRARRPDGSSSTWPPPRRSMLASTGRRRRCLGASSAACRRPDQVLLARVQSHRERPASHRRAGSARTGRRP
jgi:hypothetical protein